jgi:hypothetical protein
VSNSTGVIQSIEALPAVTEPSLRPEVSEPTEPTVESTPEFKSDLPETSARKKNGMIFVAEQTIEPHSVLISQVAGIGPSSKSKSVSDSKPDTESGRRRRRKLSASGSEQILPDQDGIDGYEEFKGGPVTSGTSADDDVDDKKGWTVKRGRRGQDPLYSRKTFTAKPKTIMVDSNPYGVIQVLWCMNIVCNGQSNPSFITASFYNPRRKNNG